MKNSLIGVKSGGVKSFSVKGSSWVISFINLCQIKSICGYFWKAMSFVVSFTPKIFLCLNISLKSKKCHIYHLIFLLNFNS